MRLALRSLLILWLTLLALSVAVGGCASETKGGQLLLAIETDMAVPKDLDKIVVHVTNVVSGVQTDFEQTLDGTPEKTLPGTIAVLGASADVALTIRVVGEKKGHARVMRELSTSLPSDGVRVLPVKLEWLCNRFTTELADGSVTSSCKNAQETCVSGTCVGVGFTNPSSLLELSASRYAPDAGSACFDPLGCFANSHEEMPTGSTLCFFEQPDSVNLASGATFNVGVKVKTSDGFCSGEQCVIPLDFDATEKKAGWYAEAHRIIVPVEVCNEMLTVVWSTSCPTTTSLSPVCQGSMPAPDSDGGDAGDALMDAPARDADASPPSDVRVDALDATPDHSMDAPDDRVAPIDARPDVSDGGVDAQPDISVPNETGPDAAPDVAADVDDGGSDASDAGVLDASDAPDVSVPPTDADLDADAAVDAAADASADADAGLDLDAGLDVLDFDALDALDALAPEVSVVDL